jgi:PAS domain-containing protein
MVHILSFLLKRYDPRDQELMLKAKFILISTLAMILTLTIMLIYTSWIAGFNTTIFLAEGVGYLILIGALACLVRGLYSLAVHIIFITGFSVTWLIMFNDPMGSLIIRMDSVVFIIGILSAMPIMLFHDKKPMFFYFAVNLTLFFCFIRFLALTTTLTYIELVDYTIDNTIVMGFVFAVATNLFSINRQVLGSMQKELSERKKAERELAKLQVLLSNTINSMPSAIMGINRKFKVLLWNSEAVQLTGIDPDKAKKSTGV